MDSKVSAEPTPRNVTGTRSTQVTITIRKKAKTPAPPSSLTQEKMPRKKATISGK